MADESWLWPVYFDHPWLGWIVFFLGSILWFPWVYGFEQLGKVLIAPIVGFRLLWVRARSEQIARVHFELKSWDNAPQKSAWLIVAGLAGKLLAFPAFVALFFSIGFPFPLIITGLTWFGVIIRDLLPFPLPALGVMQAGDVAEILACLRVQEEAEREALRREIPKSPYRGLKLLEHPSNFDRLAAGLIVAPANSLQPLPNAKEAQAQNLIITLKELASNQTTSAADRAQLLAQMNVVAFHNAPSLFASDGIGWLEEMEEIGEPEELLQLSRALHDHTLALPHSAAGQQAKARRELLARNYEQALRALQSALDLGDSSHQALTLWECLELQLPAEHLAPLFAKLRPKLLPHRLVGQLNHIKVQLEIDERSRIIFKVAGTPSKTNVFDPHELSPKVERSRPPGALALVIGLVGAGIALATSFNLDSLSAGQVFAEIVAAVLFIVMFYGLLRVCSRPIYRIRNIQGKVVFRISIPLLQRNRLPIERAMKRFQCHLIDARPKKSPAEDSP